MNPQRGQRPGGGTVARAARQWWALKLHMHTRRVWDGGSKAAREGGDGLQHGGNAAAASAEAPAGRTARSGRQLGGEDRRWCKVACMGRRSPTCRATHPIPLWATALAAHGAAPVLRTVTCDSPLPVLAGAGTGAAAAATAAAIATLRSWHASAAHQGAHSSRRSGLQIFSTDSSYWHFRETELGASRVDLQIRILSRMGSSSRPAFDAAITQVREASNLPSRWEIPTS